ncbi:MAG TPA: hypothetical protein VEZ88_00345 [Steroidobacteraceae bacterium]|nr:hypothetical protein [Steroidobacteraceae bacterium]
MLRPVLLGALLAMAAGCAGTHQTRYAAEETPTVGTCVPTASRIVSKECSSVPGRSYSKADLDRTGAITTSEALRVLDPRIVVHQ